MDKQTELEDKILDDLRKLEKLIKEMVEWITDHPDYLEDRNNREKVITCWSVIEHLLKQQEFIFTHPSETRKRLGCNERPKLTGIIKKDLDLFEDVRFGLFRSFFDAMALLKRPESGFDGLAQELTVRGQRCVLRGYLERFLELLADIDEDGKVSTESQD